MGEIALNRGMAIESESVLGPLFKTGTLGGASDQNAERNKRLYTKAQAGRESRQGGRAGAKREGCRHQAHRRRVCDHRRILHERWQLRRRRSSCSRRASTKGQLEPGVAELVKLRLGIAQFKAGQKEEARKTWSEIKGDNGSAWLARVWTAISKI